SASRPTRCRAGSSRCRAGSRSRVQCSRRIDSAVGITGRLAWGFAAAVLLRGSGAVAADCGRTPYDCALYHVGRREFSAAIGDLEPHLAAAPRDLKALNLLGIALTGAGRRDAANERFRRALA